MSKKKLSAGKAHEKARLAALKASKKAMASASTAVGVPEPPKVYKGRNAAKRYASKLAQQHYQDSVIAQQQAIITEQQKEIEELKRQLAEKNKAEEERQNKKKHDLEELQKVFNDTDWNNADPEQVFDYDSPKDWVRNKTGIDPNEYTKEEVFGEEYVENV